MIEQKDTSNTGLNQHRHDDGKNVRSIIRDIRRASFHDHNMIVYPDLPSFRKIYSECTKQALDNNEIVVLATTYDSIDKVVTSLSQSGISVASETRAGNLTILDSIRLYQINVQGAFKFIKSLLVRSNRDNKSGIFNISDLGSFFLAERLSTLVDYEQSIPKRMETPFKGFCSYHKDDFASLSKEQQERILSAHNQVMK